MTNPNRILITRTDRIGDVVLSTPVIATLRRQYPKSYLAFLTTPYTKEILEDHPMLDEVIVYDKKGEDKSILNSIKFARDLKKKSFDMAVILHPTNRMHLITWLAHIPVRLGYNKKFGLCLTHKIRHTKERGEVHEVEYNLNLLKKIGIHQFDHDIYIHPNKQAEDESRRILSNNHINAEDGFIAVHPDASCISKKWPIERFVEVINSLYESYHLPFVIIGSKESSPLAIRLKGLSTAKILNLSGLLSLKQVIELLRIAKLLITNDSGPMHIAVAGGTPVVSIFGRNQPGLSPRRWGPLGKHDIILHKDPGCEKCLAHRCRYDFKCLTDIHVDEVTNASNRILSKGKK